MEKFVDRIIETDRKAREIIEAAQQTKKQLLKKADTKAKQALEKREAEDSKKMQALNNELAQREKLEIDKADAAYIAAKHMLDHTFEQGHDTWLQEILTACKAVQ